LAIVFIGCGNMGEAVLKGALALKEEVFIIEKSRQRREYLEREYPNVVFIEDVSAVKGDALIVVAVKPQDKLSALSLIKGIRAPFGILSIMAGVKLSFFESIGAQEVVRAMPNLPAMIGRGITGVCSDKKGPFYEKAVKALEGMGKVIEVEEGRMDVITAVSGSGPAYFFFLCQCLFEFACDNGITEQDADVLVRQLALGSAEFMVKYPEIGFARMREKVTSKGGTTEAAFNVVEGQGICAGLKDAFKRALDRSKELSE